MGLFLMLRQVVDTLHEFKILDYVICTFAVVLIIYKSFKIRVYENLLSKIDYIDLIVVVLGLLYFGSYLRNRNGFSPFIKTESAFMVYILGRLYGDELLKHINKIALVSYIVVYMNLAIRIVEYVHYYKTNTLFSWETFGIDNSGGFFHYKTDLAIAMIIAVIFIYKSDANKWIKYITVFPVVSLIVFTCNARMGQVILIVEYAVIILDIKEIKRNVNKKYINYIYMFLFILINILFIFIQVSPIHKAEFLDSFSDIDLYKINRIFHSRHIIIWDNLYYFSNQNIITRLFGIDLVSDSIHNATGDRAHCLYLKIITSVGYIGTLLYIEFYRRLSIVSVSNNNRKYRYFIVSLMIMFLSIGISMESIEYTQMSWFAFIFAGGIVTFTKKNIEEREI